MEKLLAALGEEDGAIRFVGGAVRDSLMGIAVEDIDCATLHDPHEVVRRLEAAGIKAVPTGIEHGTITAVSNGTVVEVTTLRADVSTDGRRATVAFSSDWQEDAARRDFTINALYADPATGEIFDFFGGKDDLEARRVRFIGEPLQRIAEDHLRILRFFRFHARFGQGAPDAAGLAACTRRANDLMALSRERVADELLKLLRLPDPRETVALMHDGGIFAPVLPEITAQGIERLASLIDTEQAAGLEPAAIRRLAALLPQDEKSARDVAARLRLSKARTQRLARAAAPCAMLPHEQAYRQSKEAALDRLAIEGRADAMADLADWDVPVLPLKGGDLIARGITQGPEVARTLRAIETAWIDAGFPTGEAFEKIVAKALA
ncbi:CCA tRNA nucleotidyltransferase [Sphingomicrobium nitratireducens]|uniref:CCA tRNA nucleotidyltransferase n=1 Tax=Sphingomicrobium nitratireducens TaxID=2964666 RepID=UPI0022409886|nr:CCA tRNA nucleotidyltransferase [Sphingomicrobium nitratireducens]